MKQFIVLSTIAVATLLCGCVTETGSENFNPTRPGYFLYDQTSQVLSSEFSNLPPVLAFAEYIAAPDAKERERIHDLHFYSQRITHTNNQWKIIDQYSELVIDTGGKSLYDEGAVWSFCFNQNNETTKQSTITRSGIDDNHYKLQLPSDPMQSSNAKGDLAFTVTTGHQSTPYTQYSFLVSGEGECRAGNMTIGFNIINPLKYSTNHGIEAGQLTLTTTNNQGVIETAKAQIFSNMVYIEYNEYKQNWYLYDANRFYNE